MKTENEKRSKDPKETGLRQNEPMVSIAGEV
jgi:hypothetical protein